MLRVLQIHLSVGKVANVSIFFVSACSQCGEAALFEVGNAFLVKTWRSEISYDRMVSVDDTVYR